EESALSNQTQTSVAPGGPAKAMQALFIWETFTETATLQRDLVKEAVSGVDLKTVLWSSCRLWLKMLLC
ncbi:MAG: hypothetical protein V1897_11935, partial [Pseudomonadota bacterium]